MDRIEVFHFRAYDPINDQILIPFRKSPRQRIERIGGEIIPDTGELVLLFELDDQERYNPTKTK